MCDVWEGFGDDTSGGVGTQVVVSVTGVESRGGLS